MRRLAAALSLGVALSLPVATFGESLQLPPRDEAGCEVEQAIVERVPPSTWRVVAVRRCGAITCWQRWLEVAGRRLGVSQTCESLAPSDRLDNGRRE